MNRLLPTFPFRRVSGAAAIILMASVGLVQAQAPPAWRLGPAAWSFNRFSFLEAVEKTAALNLRYIEAFEGQKIAPDEPASMSPGLGTVQIGRIRSRLEAAGVQLTSIYIHDLPGEEGPCRRAFEFARQLGVRTIVSEPAPESLDLIERLAEEFQIQVALHNHPQGSSRYWHPREVLKACEGRSRWVGACADLGHWQRSGIVPVEGIRLLGDRLLSLHVKDLNELSPQGHDVPWGTGKGDIEGVLREVHRLGLQPTLFAIEYEFNWENNTAEIRQCADFFFRTAAAVHGTTPAPSSSHGLRAGAAQVDISPQKFPVIVNAMFTERSASQVVDPLFAKALVLDNGQARLALCVVDTCMMPRALIDQAKALAARQTGIPPKWMCISATHTHSAPSAMACLGSRADPDYAAALPARIAEAIAQAAGQLQPARVGWATVDDWQHTFNRRWIRRPDRLLPDPFGEPTVRANMHPGHESPDVIGPSGPVDPGLSLLAVQTLEGTPLAVYANYSQHYYDSPLLSSDYYGRFARHLQSILNAGPGFIGIMSQGTSGDLMWMDYGTPRVDIGYDAYGREIAERVGQLYRRLSWQNEISLATAERSLSLRYRVPDAQRLEWARQTVAALNGRLPQNLPEIYAGEALALHERQQTELNLQALRIGSLGITAIPCEVFALTGLKLKLQSPLQPTFNVSLANAAEGYIPPPEQHRLGGYTTWPARTAGLEPGAEPAIVETVLGLLEEVSGQARRKPFVAHGPYVETVLASRPVAYWRLEELAASTAQDLTANGRTGVFEGGVAMYLPGPGSGTGHLPDPVLKPSAFSGTQVNRAVHFAGGRMRAQPPPSGPAYTLELWLWNGLPSEARAVTGYIASLGVDGEANTGEHLGIGGTYQTGEQGRLILFGGNQRGPAIVGQRILGRRQWHHVVLVRDGARATVYLDGQPDLEAELPPEIPGRSELFIGGRCDGFANFEGRLDEVALYARALSSDEVADHFRASKLTRPAYAPTPEP